MSNYPRLQLTIFKADPFLRLTVIAFDLLEMQAVAIQHD